MIVDRQPVQLPDGRRAERIVLDDGGIRVAIGSLGATLLRIDAPDRTGALANVILGDDDLKRYPAGGADADDAYLGATCGRVANRIRDARFLLDGVTHQLAPNDGRHQLHGGSDGFHRRLWDVRALDRGVRLTLVSADGDEGFPGRLAVTATFVLADPHSLLISYRARTDRPTHVNIVAHPYFNLAGDGRGVIDEHVLRIDADSILPIDADALPHGAAMPVAGTPFDFRRSARIGDGAGWDDAQLRLAGGYNHCFRLNAPPGGLRPVAWLSDPVSGRALALATDQPGLHVYSGDWLNGGLTPCAGGTVFGPRSGLCLEAEGFPDSANTGLTPSTRLDPGRLYRSRTLLRFT